MKPKVAEVWEFESSSGNKTYETLRYTDGTTSCNCPGWTRRTDAQGNRTCKHTRSVDMGTATANAIGHSQWDKVRQPQPVSTLTEALASTSSGVPRRKFNFG